jgi:hypothetical protein
VPLGELEEHTCEALRDAAFADGVQAVEEDVGVLRELRVEACVNLRELPRELERLLRG